MPRSSGGCTLAITSPFSEIKGATKTSANLTHTYHRGALPCVRAIRQRDGQSGDPGGMEEGRLRPPIDGPSRDSTRRHERRFAPNGPEPDADYSRRQCNGDFDILAALLGDGASHLMPRVRVEHDVAILIPGDAWVLPPPVQTDAPQHTLSVGRRSPNSSHRQLRGASVEPRSMEPSPLAGRASSSPLAGRVSRSSS